MQQPRSLDLKTGAACHVRNLCLANIRVGHEVLKYVFHALLKQLYSLELINLTFSGDLGERRMLRELHSYLSSSDSEVALSLMKFRFSNIDLSQ